MNLISQRPNQWSNIVGQSRAIDVLQAILRNPNFLTRGIILYGVLGVGKLLDVNEPIPTPSGFVRNGDLRDGDTIFGETGRSVRVVKAHSAVEEEAFKIVFDDGTHTFAHAGHLWLTYSLKERYALAHSRPEWRTQRRAKRFRKTNKRWAAQRVLRCDKSGPGGSVRTTQEIMDTLLTGSTAQSNHAIPVSSPVILPKVDLPLDPYTLGAWLGDGHSSGSRFTGAPEDAKEILAHFPFPYRKAKGDDNGWIIGDGNFVRLGKFKCKTNPFTAALKSAGVLHNKHIPHEYLWASEEQRLALLQGLMDTDGSCFKSGLCEFSNMNRILSAGVYHLSSSLGLKPFWSEKRARVNGKDCGTSCVVRWTSSLPVFRLRRKLNRLPKQTRSTQNWRYIVAVEPVGRMKMRCLTVDNPSGLYLFGKNFNITHNTTTAYLVAKALMCTGSDPLGCGKCASCALIEESGIDQHPDFQEVDGAQKGGVEATKEIIEVTLSLPVLGQRKVTVIDEAQFLSPEAWAAYLKILEQGGTESVFIFVSNEVEKVKRTITSRCIKIPFERVSRSTMVGLLSKIATENNISYDLAGLDLIARHAKGVIRDAVQWLNTAAALGEIKPELVKTVIDTSLEDRCMKLLLAIGKKDQVSAVKMADEIGVNFLPQRIVEAMLSIYGRAIWQDDPESELRQVYVGLPNVGEVTSILIKWSGLSVPADVLPLIVFELLKTQQSKQIGRAAAAYQAPVSSKPAISAPQAPKSSLAAFLDDEAI